MMSAPYKRPSDSDDARKRRVEAERARIRAAFPAEFDDGAKRAFEGVKRYPKGFLDWPLERRNAFFVGFNLGYQYRLRAGDAAPAVSDDSEDLEGPDGGGDV